MGKRSTGQLGFFGRLRAAGMVLRGGLPFDAATLQRFFGGGDSLGGPSSAYSQVGVVYACVKARAEAIAGLPLMISTADDEVVEAGPLAEMAARPNAQHTGRAFWLATSSILDLFGVCHWVFELDGLRRPIAVHPVAPVQMRPVKNDAGEVTSWRHKPAGRLGGHEEALGVDEVHSIIDPNFDNPHDPLRGLSPRHAVAAAIRQYFKSDLANEASLDNGVEPGGALHTDKQLTEQQRSDTREWIQDHHSGVRNRRRFMLLEGGLEWQQLGAAFKDMEFSELKRMSREDILSAFQVPGPVLSLFEGSNYAHANAAQEAFYTNAIIPRGARLAEEWQQAVLSRYTGDRSLSVGSQRTRKLERRELVCMGFTRSRRAARQANQRFFSWFDSSQVAAVQRATLEQAQQVKMWFDLGVPLNAIIAATDAPFPEMPYGNVGYIPIGLRPADEDLLDSFTDPDGSEPEAGLLSGRQRQATEGRPRKHPRRVADAEVLRTSERQRAALWAAFRKSWEGLEDAARGRLKRHFYNLRAEVLRNLDAAADQLAPPEVEKAERTIRPDRAKDVIGQLLFNLEAANDSIVGRVSRIIHEGYRLGGEQAMKEAADATGADAPDPFRMDSQAIVDAMRAREVVLREVNRTLRRRLANRVADAIEEGQTVAQIQETIRSEFNFASNRSATIARTEVHGAVSEARQHGRRQAGVPLKSWLSSRKETGRPAHLETEIETMAHPIPNEEEFRIAGSGATCMSPGATGDPAEDINCGCDALSRYPDDSLRSVLDRYTARGFLSYDELVKRDAPTPAPATSKDADHGDEAD
ncbi:MAG: phage portal protein [Phycisphaeraceae bacterium]